MKIWKPISKYIYVLIILILIYMMLGIVSSMIPNNLIEKNSKKSAEYLLGEKDCADILVKDTSYKKEYIFNYTNALMLNTAYSIDENKPLQSFLLDRKNYIPGVTEVFNKDTQYGLISASNYNYQNQTGEYYHVTHKDSSMTIKESFEYARYWHGYLSILRPILVLFSYEKIEKLSILTFTILLIICTVLMWKRIDKISSCLFILSFIAMDSFYTSGSINEVTCFIIMLCANIYILLKYEKIKNIPLVFLIVGSITNYFDLLTLPLLTFAMPTFIYFLLKTKDEIGDWKEYIILFVNIAIAWLVGYGITWAIKWILVDLICNRNVISIALKQIIYRISSSEGNIKFTYNYVLSKNMEFLGNQVVYFTAFISAIIMGTGIIRNKNSKSKINVPELLVYIVIAILPFIWYLTLKNHSAIHARFTHRLLIISIYAFWMVLAKIWGFDKDEKIINKKKFKNFRQL